MPFSIRPYRPVPLHCSVTNNVSSYLKFPLAYLSGFCLLIALLALSSEPGYAEWVFVSGDDEAGMTVYVDPATIRRNGDLVKMWHLSDRKTMEGYGSITSQREYDCAAARHRLLGASIFSGHMGRGQVLEDNLEASQWIPVAPDSGQALWKIACGKK